MIKLRLGSIKHLTQGHLTTEGWDSNPGLSGSKVCALDYHIILLGIHSFNFNFSLKLLKVITGRLLFRASFFF